MATRAEQILKRVNQPKVSEEQRSIVEEQRQKPLRLEEDGKRLKEKEAARELFRPSGVLEIMEELNEKIPHSLVNIYPCQSVNRSASINDGMESDYKCPQIGLDIYNPRPCDDESDRFPSIRNGEAFMYAEILVTLVLPGSKLRKEPGLYVRNKKVGVDGSLDDLLAEAISDPTLHYADVSIENDGMGFGAGF